MGWGTRRRLLVARGKSVATEREEPMGRNYASLCRELEVSDCTGGRGEGQSGGMHACMLHTSTHTAASEAGDVGTAPVPI